VRVRRVDDHHHLEESKILALKYSRNLPEVEVDEVALRSAVALAGGSH
jgi:hypothetical protein